MNSKLTIDPKVFFQAYLVDHFVYKQLTLKNCFDNYSTLRPILLAGMDEADDKAYLHTLRAEIRATYFQCIETLFEMIFALSVRGRTVDNENMWYLLSTSDWRRNFKRILKIAEGDLSFLEQTVIAGRELEMSLLQYIFFFGVHGSIPTETVATSLAVIRKTLPVLASEFSDRGEYNAIKHSIRLFPFIAKWEIGATDGQGPKISFDLSDSMTFLREEPDETLIHETRQFDTERDFNMTVLGARLISNIIRGRRAYFFKEGVTLFTFEEEALMSANKRSVAVQNLSISIKPIYETPTQTPNSGS